MSTETNEGLKLLGMAIGAGGVGSLATLIASRRQLKKYKALPERRADHTDAIIRRAADAAAEASAQSVAKAFELHLGTKNGEIKQDIQEVVAYVRNHPVLCAEIHKRVDGQISDVKSIALAADEKAQQALLQGHR